MVATITVPGTLTVRVNAMAACSPRKCERWRVATESNKNGDGLFGRLENSKGLFRRLENSNLKDEHRMLWASLDHNINKTDSKDCIRQL
jgi:hypothetical protein